MIKASATDILKYLSYLSISNFLIFSKKVLYIAYFDHNTDLDRARETRVYHIFESSVCLGIDTIFSWSYDAAYIKEITNLLTMCVFWFDYIFDFG